MKPGILTLTTDFGMGGPYVAALKGVLLDLAPGTQFVDVCHTISPQNILEGGFVLAGIVDVFPKGTVHLAVVDPGRGHRPAADRGLGRGSMVRASRQWPDHGSSARPDHCRDLGDHQPGNAALRCLGHFSRARHPRPGLRSSGQRGRSGRARPPLARSSSPSGISSRTPMSKDSSAR